MLKLKIFIPYCVLAHKRYFISISSAVLYIVASFIVCDLIFYDCPNAASFLHIFDKVKYKTNQ